MNSIRAKVELITGVGEFIQADITADLEDIEVELACVDPSGEIIRQVSSSSMVIQTSQPINTNVLGGSPQTSVRLLVLVADPV